MEIKTKIYKWDIIRLKSFCAAKGTINKMKRQPEEQEKMFVHDVTNKEKKDTDLQNSLLDSGRRQGWDVSKEQH